MKILTVNYGESFYYSDELKKCARAYVGNLPEDVNVLVSIGSSGCAIASAMMMISDRPLEHYSVRRKRNEGHSSSHAGFIRRHNKDMIACFVDDFISTGASVDKVLKWDIENYDFIKYVLVSRGDTYCVSTGIKKVEIINHIYIQKEK